MTAYPQIPYLIARKKRHQNAILKRAATALLPLKRPPKQRTEQKTGLKERELSSPGERPMSQFGKSPTQAVVFPALDQARWLQCTSPLCQGFVDLRPGEGGVNPTLALQIASRPSLSAAMIWKEESVSITRTSFSPAFFEECIVLGCPSANALRMPILWI